MNNTTYTIADITIAELLQDKAALQAALDQLEAARDEAVETSNNFRAHVLEICDGMIAQETSTIKLEEGHDLNPEYRHQFLRAVGKIRTIFENADYLKNTKIAESHVRIAAALDKK